MYCLQIFLIFLLFVITFSIHVSSLHSKPYREIKLHLNKSNHIINWNIFWPSTWIRNENNWKLHSFLAYRNRKWKEQANQSRFKKIKLIHTNNIQANLDTKRNQFGHDNLKKSTLSIHLYQERKLSKFDQGSQQNQNTVKIQISEKLPCAIPKWVNQKEIGISLPVFYFNPCQPDPGRHCEFIYKNFILKNKFIQCDKSGKAIVKSCPQNCKFDSKLQECSYSYTLRILCVIPSWVNQNEIGTKLPTFQVNPCHSDITRKCEYKYIRNKYDDTKFIQCDKSGNAIIKSCPPSFKWDDKSNQCSLKTTMIITSTEKSTIFSSNKTVQDLTKTDTITATTWNSYITSNINTRGTIPPCLIPDWDNQTDNGTELPPYFLNPCHSDITRKCEYKYIRNKYDDTKFIRCDKSGNAIIKSCPPSFKWDDKNNQCSLKTTMMVTSTEESTIFSSKNTVRDLTKTDTITAPESTSVETPTSLPIKKLTTLPTSTEIKVETTRISYITSNINTRGTNPPCLIPDWDNQTDNGTELPSYYLNPCKSQPTNNCKFNYMPFYINDTKFIQCDKYGNARLKSCPTSFKWDKSFNECLPEAVITTNPPCLIPDWDNLTDNGTELPSYYLNPCKSQPTNNCKFNYMPFHLNDTKFIQCDKYGNARLKSCPTSFKWDKSFNECLPEAVITTNPPCLIPDWDNLTDNGTELPSYYLNPCKSQPTNNCKFNYMPFHLNDTKFIQCDEYGNARLKSCPTSFKWDKSFNECLPEAVITTNPPCLIPDWDNLTDNGTELPSYYLNPCKSQPTNNCKFNYMPFHLNDTKFIQCDKYGNARLKSCPTSFKWDKSFNECLPEAVITTNPPCLIPDWDNLTDNGTELPSYYLNPCKSQPTNNCKFNYMPFHLNDTKFIQCDEYGNARLKSCPTSFKWDKSFNECLPEAVITTNPPCLIPDWDNLTDNGTELPSYYLNPCHSDITRKCEYKYIRNKYDDTKFIRCDKSGNAIIKSCPPSFKWDDKNNQCSLKTTMMVTSTEESTIFSSKNTVRDLTKTDTITAPESTSVETPTSLPIKKLTTLPTSTEIKVETTGISYITSNINTRGTNPPCLIPDWDNQTDNGTELPSYYLNPCKSQPTNNCKFNYMPFYINDTKFIQCDKYGNARLKSCPTSFKWDKSFNECLPEAVITTNPPCLIPDWDNLTDNGTELPSYYLNPCKSQPTNNCKFNYMPFHLNDTKFIQCDEYGNARLKSCPTSFKWDKSFNECLPEAVITTNPPCLIPDWDNLTDNGTELPSYYLNPCHSDITRKCEYKYIRNKYDDTKFIRCDKSGNAIIKSCPPSFKWDDKNNQCSLKTTMMVTSTEESTIFSSKNTVRDLTKTDTITAPESTSVETPTSLPIKKLTTLPTSTEIKVETTGISYITSNINTRGTNPPCLIPDWDNQTDNGTELPSYYLNPCKSQPTNNCKFNYMPFYINDTKFIQCDKYGNARLKSCPTSFKWDKSFNECLPEAVITTNPPCLIPDWDNLTDNGTELPSYYLNPCKSQPTNNCKFNYMPFHLNDTKFIQCDKYGNARLKSCPTSFKWDKSFNECLPEAVITTNPPCLIPDWDNLTDNGTELPSYYLNPCKSQPTNNCKFNYMPFHLNDTKFIQCDEYGNARLKSCPTSFKWDKSFNECLPEAVITTNPPCLIPDWDNLTDNGTELPSYYLNPCKSQPTNNCKFNYMPFHLNDTKFIQCDEYGNARLKSCPTYFKWDKSFNECLPEAVITTNPPCLIPDWDNLTDNGTEFPSYYLNPCHSDITRKCEYKYIRNKYDDTKFIRCDKSGNAIIKSCPPSFKWDDKNNQCSLKTTMMVTSTEESTIFSSKNTVQDLTKTDTISSTEIKVETTGISYITSNINTRGTNPTCLIPDWDNQTDNGTELPPYYPNPCMSQPTNNCKFNYKPFYIDDTKFIQCDKYGNARVKLCPTSFRWDNTGNRCLLEIITTMKIPCLIPSGVNQTEKASYLPHIYPNPCTKDPSRSCEFSFKPFLLDPHKFIKCDKFGKASLKSCQVSFRWFQTVQQCLPQIVTTFTPQCQIPAWVNQNEHGTPLPSFYPNPCTADPNRICLFIYKRFLLDQHKFILCDKDGHSLIKSCPPNFKWVVHDQKCSIENIQSTINPQCEVPAWVNEKEKGEPLESFYPNPCLADLSRNCEFIYLLYILDKHKFIQCDRFGNAVKKSCPPHNIWNNHIKQCSIQNIMTTIRPTCSVPNWMNPNEMGLTLPSYLPNPCNSTSIQTCKYFTYVKDDHKFIECDQYGKAWIKSCPPISRWDTTFKKCTAIING